MKSIDMYKPPQNYELEELKKENLRRDLGMLHDWGIMTDTDVKEAWDRWESQR